MRRRHFLSLALALPALPLARAAEPKAALDGKITVPLAEFVKAGGARVEYHVGQLPSISALRLLSRRLNLYDVCRLDSSFTCTWNGPPTVERLNELAQLTGVIDVRPWAPLTDEDAEAFHDQFQSHITLPQETYAAKSPRAYELYAISVEQGWRAHIDGMVAAGMLVKLPKGTSCISVGWNSEVRPPSRTIKVRHGDRFGPKLFVYESAIPK